MTANRQLQTPKTRSAKRNETNTTFRDLLETPPLSKWESEDEYAALYDKIMKAVAPRDPFAVGFSNSSIRPGKFCVFDD